MSFVKLLARCLGYVWALPNSVIGAALGIVALACGARARLVDGVVEIGGGRLGTLAARLPGSRGFAAITLGHVVLGVSHASLRSVRTHEHVHVRQYERWGPLFLPLYLGSSLVQLVLRRRPYRDNRFEREAYARATPHRPRSPDDGDRSARSGGG